MNRMSFVVYGSNSNNNMIYSSNDARFHEVATIIRGERYRKNV